MSERRCSCDEDEPCYQNRRRLSPWRVLAWAFVAFLIASMFHLVVTAPW